MPQDIFLYQRFSEYVRPGTLLCRVLSRLLCIGADLKLSPPGRVCNTYVPSENFRHNHSLARFKIDVHRSTLTNRS